MSLIDALSRTMYLSLLVGGLAQADLQSDFFEVLMKGQKQKAVEPPKIKKAIEVIEKKRGSKSEETQILPANPYLVQTDRTLSITYINQIIYLKFKDKTLCRAQLETYQDQSMYNGLRVLCVKEGQAPQAFSETL